jgi:hypothetical protein
MNYFNWDDFDLWFGKLIIVMVGILVFSILLLFILLVVLCLIGIGSQGYQLIFH